MNRNTEILNMILANKIHLYIKITMHHDWIELMSGVKSCLTILKSIGIIHNDRKIILSYPLIKKCLSKFNPPIYDF